jgi:membrane carboxypeptidase/penicillin-binding protein
VKVRRGLGISLVVLFLLLAIAGGWLYLWLFHELPHPEDINNYIALQGENNQHIPISLLDVPDTLRWATLSVLDPQFYARPTRIQLRGLVRTWSLLARGNLGRDGASLTEYLVLDLMMVSGGRVDDPRRQRMREIVLGIAIAQRYTKDEVLGMYLNLTVYGEGIYGVEAAGQYYFGKHAWELSLAESAMLVSIWRMEGFNSAEDLESIVELQQAVLEMMAYEGYITRDEARAAEGEVVSFVR